MFEIEKNIKAVIFDLDGTLIDSMWMWHAIDIEYLGKYGIDIPDDLQKSIEGKSFTETAVYFKERFNIPETVEEIKENWNKMSMDMYCNRVPLKEGAKNCVKTLSDKGYKLGIATSNSRILAEAVLRSKGIYEYFSAIITGCDVTKGKPDPEGYLKAAKLLKVNPSECLVFEDIPNGIMAGKNAGMTVCAVEDTYSHELADMKRKLADYYIYDYNEINSLINIPTGIFAKRTFVPAAESLQV